MTFGICSADFKNKAAISKYYTISIYVVIVYTAGLHLLIPNGCIWYYVELFTLSPIQTFIDTYCNLLGIFSSESGRVKSQEQNF